MRKIPLAKLPNYIHSHEPFNGSSVTAKQEGALYCVYSYSTLIATFSGNTMMITVLVILLVSYSTY